MRCHNDACALRLEDFDEIEHIEAVGSPQVEVDESQLDGFLPQNHLRRRNAAGRPAFVVLGGKDGGQQTAGGFIVIHDQDAEAVVGFADRHQKSLSLKSIAHGYIGGVRAEGACVLQKMEVGVVRGNVPPAKNKVILQNQLSGRRVAVQTFQNFA